MTPAKASVSRMLDFEMPIRERQAPVVGATLKGVLFHISMLEGVATDASPFKYWS